MDRSLYTKTSKYYKNEFKNVLGNLNGQMTPCDLCNIISYYAFHAVSNDKDIEVRIDTHIILFDCMLACYDVIQ